MYIEKKESKTLEKRRNDGRSKTQKKAAKAGRRTNKDKSAISRKTTRKVAEGRKRREILVTYFRGDWLTSCK